MKYIYWTLVTGIISIGIVGCKSSQIVKPEKPESEAQTRVFQPKLSSINIPLEISVPNLEKLANKQLQGVLYKDDSYEDNNQDGLKLTITKLSDIQVTAKNEEVYFSVPLNIVANVQKSILGVDLTKGTDFDAMLKFKTTIDLNSKWGLITQTTSQGYEFLRKPVIQIGTFSIPITPAVSKILDQQLPEVSKLLDGQVKNMINVRSLVSGVWTDIQQPYLLNQAMNAWLKMSPTQFYMTPLKTSDKRILLNVGMDTYLEVKAGEKPESKVNPVLPDLVKKASTTDVFSLSLGSDVTFAQATELLKKSLVGYIYQEKKRRIEVTDAEVSGNGDKVVVKVSFMGSANGDVYLSGIPAYDSTSESIVFKNFDFDLKSKNVLHKTAEWMLHGFFKKKMEEFMKFSIKDQIEQSNQILEKELKTNKIADDLTLECKILKIKPEDIFLTPNSMRAIIQVEGKAKAIYGGDLK